MVFNKSEFYQNNFYNIKLTDSFKEKLLDAVSKRENVLVTIDASHYGFLNKNGVIYRHDTVRDCIPSFVYPDCKPIIENHRPKDSDKFGRIIAADYKETAFYNELISKGIKLEDLSTSQYMELCKSTLIPMQEKNHNYNGLAFCQVVGKIDHKSGIQKILDSEFLHVSIGADPKKMICSVCGKDQIKNGKSDICDHYFSKGHDGIFMLAEELEYEELSFVQKPADKFGKVTFIHDGVETEVEPIEVDAQLDIVLAKDFFKLADGKKIVCMDNICKVINEPEDKMNKKKEGQKTLNVSYVDEFTVEGLKDVKLTDSEDEINLEEVLKLSDEVMGELTNRDFAIVQKTAEGIKRRFPIHNSDNVKAAVQLINKAEDLTEPEKDKAVASIGRAAKKAGIEFKITDDEAVAEETVAEVVAEAVAEAVAEVEEVAAEVVAEAKKTVSDLVKEIKTLLEAIEADKLSDSENPVDEVITMLTDFADSAEWAKAGLSVKLTDYLVANGKEVVEAGKVAELTDSLAEREEEVAVLEDQLMEVNYTLRSGVVDDIITSREALSIADADKEAEKASLMKLPYDQLLKQRTDFGILKSKLSEQPVNNNAKDIKVIPDPLNDSEGEEEVVEVVIEDKDNTKSDPDAFIQALTNLLRNR